MENLTLLTYTNTKCSDIHKIYFDRINKYFNNVNQVVLTDNELKIDNIKTVIYNDDTKYYQQMIDGLNKIETDYLIYSQEDYILFDYVNCEMLQKYINLLDEDKNISFIRLIQSGVNFVHNSYNNDLFYLDPSHEYYFSTQITLWRVKDLISMFTHSKVDVIWDEPKNSIYLKNLGKIGLCTKEKGSPVGGHFNSAIYPYTATAVVKGKWNYSEYKNELDIIFNEYNINKNNRGFR